MELTPAKFLALFLFLSVAGRLLFIFAARLVSWILGRMIGAQVKFRFGGLNSLKDITLNFKKGALESLVIGEVRLLTRRPSRDSQNSELARSCVFQVLFYDAEIVIRKNSKQSLKKGHHQKRHSYSHGKWMIFANLAKYVTVSVAELLVQLPDWTFEVKELELGMDGDESGLSVLDMKLLLTACSIHEREDRIYENSLSFGQRVLTIGGLGSVADGPSAVCSVEHICISSICGHGREKGMVIKQLDVIFGDIFVDVDDELLGKKLFASDNTGAQSSVHPQEPITTMQPAEKGHSHFLTNFPEKASLNMPRLLIKCSHKEKGCKMENDITGVQFVCAKVQNVDDFGGPLCHLDIHVDSGEIHLLRDADMSLVEIMKAAIVASLEIPKETNNTLQVEVDFKLGGAQCNVLPKKFEEWIDVVHIIKAKHRILDSSTKSKTKISKKRIKWTSTISAPEMAVSMYDLDGIVLYNIGLQTSHIFLNSALNQNTGFHTELGELYVYKVDEQHNFHKNLFGIDTSPNCLLQISRVIVDWDVSEPDCGENENEQKKGILMVEVSGISMYLTLNRVQSFLSSCMSIVFHFNRTLNIGQKHKPGKESMKRKGKGRISKFKILTEGISIQYCAEMLIIDEDVPDPKKVNFGSQGGEVIYQTNKDGKPRTASIKVAKFRGIEASTLVYKSSIDIARLQLLIDSNKHDTQVDFQRLRGIYQELEPQMKPVTEITFASLENGQIIYRMIDAGSGLPDCLVCISDLRGRWEPDMHLFFLDAFMHLKSFHKKQKKKYSMNSDRSALENSYGDRDVFEKGSKRSMTVAVDLEQVYFSAALADGVDASLSVSSMFSEDFKVGILLEELKVMLNGAAVIRSKRLQIAKVPCFIQNKRENTDSQECSKCGTEISSSWDYLIQGAEVRIILPYKLECRAIDDAIEDTWRGLKLVMMANKMITTGPSSQKSKLEKQSLMRSSVGAVKFSLESITAEIEEEPLQGWLDEHHHLISKQRIELDVRERLLDEIFSGNCRIGVRPGTRSDNSCSNVSEFGGNELDFSDPSIYGKLKERLQTQGFEAYKRVCKALQPYQSSGSVRSPFQSGFKPSVNRGSLMSIKASNLEVTLMDIEGGKVGMIEQIRKLDCVPSETEIPYSRVLGKRVNITTSLLVVQLRNYTLPILSGEGGKCNGQLIFARQATCFPNQIPQGLYIGRWRKITMLRSESGTTPPFKMFSELPIEFDKAEVAYGVGFEPLLTDISYAFTVALRRDDLSVHDLDDSDKTSGNFYQINTYAKYRASQPVKKERNLPWWDDMRYYIHGKNSIFAKQFKWVFLANTNPYEDKDMMKIEAESMHIQHQEGSLSFSANNFNLSITSSKMKVDQINCSTKIKDKCMPIKEKQGCIESPFFRLDITMDWDCETGNPQFHYLHAFPEDLVVREKVYDPFRSTSLVLRWDFHLGDAISVEQFTSLLGEMGNSSFRFTPAYSRRSSVRRYPKESSQSFHKTGNWLDVPTMSIAGHDLAWIFRWWSTMYSPPHKLRTFSKWPTFGLPRVPRSGNLSLDKVLTDFMLRVDSIPTKIKHITLHRDDPAKGLTFSMRRLKYELWYSRGGQRYTSDSKRDILELVYQGLDLDKLKAELQRESDMQIKLITEGSERVSSRTTQDAISSTTSTESSFFFTTEYFSLLKQAPKADTSRLSSWREAACRSSSRGTVEFPQDTGNDPNISDASDGDDFIVLSDNCLRVSLHSLRLLWTISNRDAVWAWVENIHKAFESPKPSPSRQYARKILEKQNKLMEAELGLEEGSSSGSATLQNRGPSATPSQQLPNSSPVRRSINSTDGSQGAMDIGTEEGTMHFMVNVVEPQFNLQSEDARGRFLLAAASGKVMARSIRSIMDVRPEMIAHTLKSGGEHLSGNMRELSWSRRELSVILEQVQAHVAPTDVDPGAGLQWLPKIPRSTQKVKRTGPLLERVFTPCEMYFQYTRCKSEATDIKVKALKELSFNSSSITATMTSRQFQVMVHVISNLLLARLPKPRRNLSLYGDIEEDDIEEDDIEEVTDEVVPDGVPEVERAHIKLEESERDLKLLLSDIKRIEQGTSETAEADKKGRDTKLWMLQCGNRTLVAELKLDLNKKLKANKLAVKTLRIARQRAAQQQFKEKEKSKSIPSAMRISWTIEKIVWNMISDGQAFAEAEISSMNLNVDRDFHEVGIAQFSAKRFVVKNCLLDAKSNTVLSAWNPPNEWGRTLMLRVDAKQGAPKEGHSPLELFQVEVYPLRINLTDRMFTMMWEYFFPKEEKDIQRRLDWERSTTAAVTRGRKVSGMTDLPASSTSKLRGNQTQLRNDRPGVDVDLAEQTNKREIKPAKSSFDRIQEDNLPEYLGIELQKKDTGSVCLSRNNVLLEESDNAHHNYQPLLNKNENGYHKSRGNSRVNKSHKPLASRDEKKLARSRIPHTNLEIHNIKITQVELLITYEGSMFSANEKRFLLDTFTRGEFSGTWRKLFDEITKHVVWSICKSLVGAQESPSWISEVPDLFSLISRNLSQRPELDFVNLVRRNARAGEAEKRRKFKKKLQAEYHGDESSSSDSELKRPQDRAGEGFVSSVRVLFNSQRKKTRAEGSKHRHIDGEGTSDGDWLERTEADSSTFSRQPSITKVKRLIRRRTIKLLASTRHRGSMIFKETAQMSPSLQSCEEVSSDTSSRYEDFND